MIVPEEMTGLYEPGWARLLVQGFTKTVIFLDKESCGVLTKCLVFACRRPQLSPVPVNLSSASKYFPLVFSMMV